MRDLAPMPPNGPTSGEQLLIPARDAARLLAVSERTLWSITHPRGSIVPVRIGSRCLYSPETLRQWITLQMAPGEEGRHDGP